VAEKEYVFMEDKNMFAKIVVEKGICIHGKIKYNCGDC